MNHYYTNEKNAQIILYLLKAHNIRNVIVSPGSTNTALVASMQQDPHFKMYSAVDERSAAYMACGLAAELGEPVVISCTGATASRNYLPGLTEAFYRKLPILAVTSSQALSKVGHHVPQVIDRSVLPIDTVKYSVSLPIVKDEDDYWECEIKVNSAILNLRRYGGGPVHINLPTTYAKPFETRKLPECRVLERFTLHDRLPKLKGRVAVFIGSHQHWSQDETEALERFCESNDAVVFCDHTSSYKGRFRVQYSLAASQAKFDQERYRPDILIHIGEISGDYPSFTMAGKEVWRVSEDGEIRDTFRRLRYVFDMPESEFFKRFSGENKRESTYYNDCKSLITDINNRIRELPFSNIWVASRIAGEIPEDSVIHFGILNSLRSWNLFDLPSTVFSASNVGGFGIDGSLSSIVGASLVNSNKLYFAVVGDLAFFYDINVLGNRHVGKNLRILLINNGKGTEFTLYNHQDSYFGKSANSFIAAEGHFGRKHPDLVKNFSENLGFKYITASGKEDFEHSYGEFLAKEVGHQPIIFEVFTDGEEESLALEMIRNIKSSSKGKSKEFAKQVLGPKGTRALKKFVNR